MPIVLRIGPYQIGFWSKENTEPPHVHARRDRKVAKFWLEPTIRLGRHRGFGKHELNALKRIVQENRNELLRAWHEHFGNR